MSFKILCRAFANSARNLDENKARKFQASLNFIKFCILI
ncbi:hypothetical protein CAMGR0001_0896 [Campylobacter gracilis RM3268]|uniref:Uncharacterized protein n=1 Tax=Campylobacter gracilis RM3268 TaxID=553220 RepID=C8PGA3_9BACT|nr:hypothetical protein CAMGR0001_0896 [Campylobacter gracilis RM3268]